MAVTRLKRKGRKNKLRAKVRAQKMKLEGFKPVIKQVDVEAAKEEFANAAKKPAKAKAEKEEKVVEAKAEQQPAAEEAKPAKKKAAAKPKAAAKDTAEKKPAKKKAAPKAKKAEKKDEE